MNIRCGINADTDPLARLFTAAVHGLTTTCYDPAQRAAWAPQPPDSDDWQQRLSTRHTLVAVRHNETAGFIAYTLDGYIDLLFTAPTHARRGVASRLYHRAQSTLLAQDVYELSTHASLNARPFFAHHGFHITAKQQVHVRGEWLLRFAMHKSIPRAIPEA